jgi:hypothetical protein
MLNKRFAKTGLILAIVAILVIVPMSVAFAGQPNQSCQDQTQTPGQSVSAPGSAFSPTGTAGGVYAGQQPQNSNNPKSVSQYDVACLQVSQH